MSENLQKPPNGLKISRSTTLWVFVGLALSSSIVVAISYLSGVTLTDFEKFGFIPFFLAGVVSSCRLLVQVIRSELNGEISELFAAFDPVPVAAASIGQVHLAELHTGRPVAVKVQRPNARRQIEADIALLRQVGRIVKSRVERLEFDLGIEG